MLKSHVGPLNIQFIFAWFCKEWQKKSKNETQNKWPDDVANRNQPFRFIADTHKKKHNNDNGQKLMQVNCKTRNINIIILLVEFSFFSRAHFIRIFAHTCLFNSICLVCVAIFLCDVVIVNERFYLIFQRVLLLIFFFVLKCILCTFPICIYLVIVLDSYRFLASFPGNANTFEYHNGTLIFFKGAYNWC